MWPSIERLNRLHGIMYRARNTYQPTDGNILPSYFYSMLDDADRSLQYWRAIHSCIGELRKHLEQHDKTRQIVVVDIGVGTGMLSAFALLAGADLVIGVDVNTAAVAAAEAAIRAVNDVEQIDISSRFVSVLVGLKDRTAQQIRTKIDAKLGRTPFNDIIERALPFDVVISEILGTLVFGESMDKFLPPYIELTQEHDNRVFAVPQICRQYFGIYEFPNVPNHLKFAIESALDAVPPRYCPTDSRGIGIPLYLHDSRSVCTKQCFYEAVYTHKRPEGKKTHPKQMVSIESKSDCLRLGICEWICVLWNEVELANTLEQYRRIARESGDRYALTRQEAWGFMICDANVAERIEVKYTISDGMQLTMYKGKNDVTALRQVAEYNECSYVCYTADTALARDIANVVKFHAFHKGTDQPFKALIVNDTTGGALCTALSQIDQLQIEVRYTPDWQKTHMITRMVVRNLVSVGATTIQCEEMDSRKNMRNMRLSMTFDCVILPELFYMTRDHARRMAVYKNLLNNPTQAQFFTIPSLETLTTKGFNYDCIVQNVAPENCKHIMPILRQVSGLPQIFKHPDVHLSTREFPALPFLMSQCAIRTTGDEHQTFNLHEVHGEYPCANLHNLRLLVESGDISSLCARMWSGSGLIIRVGPENIRYHNVLLEEPSEEEDDEEDDDDF